MRRRWPKLALAGLGLVMAGALVVALVTSRKLAGAIPGEAPILSMAAIEKGFVVGTAKGLYVSPDGKEWTKVKKYSGKRVLVVRAADRAVMMHNKILLETSDLVTYEPAYGVIQDGIAMAGDPEGNIYIAEDARHLVLIKSDDSLQRVTAIDGPREVITMGGIPGDPVVILAGGLTSGFWRSLGGDRPWRQILKTPARSILVDRTKQDRILLGTAGGIFYSNDEGFKWSYSEMRLPVEALAEHQGIYYALTADRILYFSKTGISGWNRLVE